MVRPFWHQCVQSREVQSGRTVRFPQLAKLRIHLESLSNLRWWLCRQSLVGQFLCPMIFQLLRSQIGHQRRWSLNQRRRHFLWFRHYQSNGFVWKFLQ